MPQDQSSNPAGRIEVICGCMFAGKTARLIERLTAAQASGLRVVACKHRLDNRYDLWRLMTHDGRACPATPVAGCSEILACVGAAEVVGVDEAQFFGRGLLAVCRRLAAEGRTLILAGIDHDAWGQPFPPLPQLKQIADAVEVLHAPCAVCGRPACFSQRMVPVTDGQMVGGPEEYQPRCGVCFEPLPAPAPVY